MTKTTRRILKLACARRNQKIAKTDKKANDDREKSPVIRSTTTDDSTSETLELYFLATYTLIASGATLDGRKVPQKLLRKYILIIVKNGCKSEEQ